MRKLRHSSLEPSSKLACVQDAPLRPDKDKEEKYDVTLPWYQNFWITRMGSLSNGDGNDDGYDKKAKGF